MYYTTRFQRRMGSSFQDEYRHRQISLSGLKRDGKAEQEVSLILGRTMFVGRHTVRGTISVCHRWWS